MTAEDIAIALNSFQLEQLVEVAKSGERGVDVRWGPSPNPFSLFFINKKFPGLLTGFSEEEDRDGTRVKLTELGREVAAQAGVTRMGGDGEAGSVAKP